MIQIDPHTVKIIASKLRAYRDMLIATEVQPAEPEQLICDEIDETELLIKKLREVVYA